MKKILGPMALMLGLLLTGCGGKEVPPTTDPDAIRKEQDRLRNEIPGAVKGGVQQEQDRLRGKMPGSKP